MTFLEKHLILNDLIRFCPSIAARIHATVLPIDRKLNGYHQFGYHIIVSGKSFDITMDYLEEDGRYAPVAKQWSIVCHRKILNLCSSLGEVFLFIEEHIHPFE